MQVKQWPISSKIGWIKVQAISKVKKMDGDGDKNSQILSPK